MAKENIDNQKKLSMKEFFNTMKWLFLFNFKLSPGFALSQIIIRMILNISPLFNAYIFARLLDKIIKILGNSSASLNDIIPLLLLLLCFNLIISAFNSAYSSIMASMGNLSSYMVPIILSKQISSLGIQTLENPEVVNKIQRARETMNSTNNDFERLVISCSQVIVFIVTSIVVIKIMPLIALIIVIATIPEVVSNKIYMRRNWLYWRTETENIRRSNGCNSTLNETSNLQEITITSSFNFISDISRKFTDRFMALQIKNFKEWYLSGFLFGSIGDIAGIFGYFSIFKNLFYKFISIGDVTFQMRALDMFSSNLSIMINSFNGLLERANRVNEVKIVFDMKPIVDDGNIKLGKIDFAPNIKFNNVNFKYPGADRYIINNLSLNIKPGEKIAIVGENGAGKTTLVKLLSRFYKIDSGSILLNDININNIEIKDWYKNLGVLFQDFNTYPYLSLKDNIFLGKSDENLDMDKIKIAATQANIDSFIGKYKDGFDQILSEKFKGGTRPSTGQWQKIAIARFFYRNSPVVVFDEPTASIDAVSEAEIFGKIYDFFKGKTVIIISHRFSTVRNADKIYVLDNGKIIESGKHTELMKLKGRYYNAFNIQAKGYK